MRRAKTEVAAAARSVVADAEHLLATAGEALEDIRA
jgi:hypothetical protein